jgi:hypothetical protein
MIPESTWGDQPRLAMFLSESIKLAYKQPAKMQNALRTRTWQAACEKSVMGVDDD